MPEICVYPSVVQAVAGDDFTVFAYMIDGSIRKYDVKPLIKKGGVFSQLADIEFFKNKLTVLNDTVAWDISGKRDPADCIDIDPFSISESPLVSDPINKI